MISTFWHTAFCIERNQEWVLQNAISLTDSNAAYQSRLCRAVWQISYPIRLAESPPATMDDARLSNDSRTTVKTPALAETNTNLGYRRARSDGYPRRV